MNDAMNHGVKPRAKTGKIIIVRGGKDRKAKEGQKNRQNLRCSHYLEEKLNKICLIFIKFVHLIQVTI